MDEVTAATTAAPAAIGDLMTSPAALALVALGAAVMHGLEAALSATWRRRLARLTPLVPVVVCAMAALVPDLLPGATLGARLQAALILGLGGQAARRVVVGDKAPR